MHGGLGDDLFIVDNVNDTAIEVAGAGTDKVQSSVTFTLADNVEYLTLSGAADLNGTNSGNNILNGKGGADAMHGGLGNDTFIFDNAGDAAVEIASAGTDSVRSSVTHRLAANIESLTLSGGAAINGTGNDLANTLVGNSGANRLDGSAGQTR